MDEMNSLITYQGEWTSKPSKDEFINEFDRNNYCVGPWGFWFHPYGTIVSNYQDIFVPYYILAKWFNGTYEI